VHISVHIPYSKYAGFDALTSSGGVMSRKSPRAERHGARATSMNRHSSGDVNWSCSQ